VANHFSPAPNHAILQKTCYEDSRHRGFERRSMTEQLSHDRFDPHTFLTSVRGARVSTSRYHPGQVIFAQGDHADAVFYIQQGKVTLTIATRSGREAVLTILGEHMFFGEGALVLKPVRPWTAAAISDCILDRIGRREMIRLLHENSAFADIFTEHLLKRSSRTEADLADHLLNSSEKRLARSLLLLSNFGRESGPKPITTKITQQMLAEMVGTTRPRISFFMNKFRKAGFVDYNGHLTVHNTLLNVLLDD